MHGEGTNSFPVIESCACFSNLIASSDETEAPPKLLHVCKRAFYETGNDVGCNAKCECAGRSEKYSPGNDTVDGQLRICNSDVSFCSSQATFLGGDSLHPDDTSTRI